MLQALVFGLAALGAFTLTVGLSLGLYAYRAYRHIVSDLKRMVGQVPPSRWP